MAELLRWCRGPLLPEPPTREKFLWAEQDVNSRESATGYQAFRKALPYTEMGIGEAGGGEGEKQRDRLRFRPGAPMMPSLPAAS
jgi:hypothetical protein